MVLIVVLVLLGLLVALLLQAQVLARSTLKREASALRKVRLQSAATDAVLYGLQKLADDEDFLVDHTGESWALPKEMMQPSGPVTWLQITDLNRMFDLNNLAFPSGGDDIKSPVNILIEILTLCGDFAPIERVEALLDWIDQNDQGTRENAYYEKLKPPYVCANSWVTSWAEIPYVAAFSRDYFKPKPRRRGLKPFSPDLLDCLFIGPFSRTRPVPVNINTASREVLLGILGMDREDGVQHILTLRQREPFGTPKSLVSLLEGSAHAESILPYLDVKSSIFKVDARAYEKGQTAQISAKVRRAADGSVTILQWIL